MDLLCLYWGKFGDSTSNIVESMNSSLLKIRKRPVYGVVTGLLAFQSEKSHKEMTCGFEDFAVNRLAEHQVESLNFAVVDTDEFIKLVRTPDGVESQPEALPLGHLLPRVAGAQRCREGFADAPVVGGCSRCPLLFLELLQGLLHLAHPDVAARHVLPDAAKLFLVLVDVVPRVLKRLFLGLELRGVPRVVPVPEGRVDLHRGLVLGELLVELGVWMEERRDAKLVYRDPIDDVVQQGVLPDVGGGFE